MCLTNTEVDCKMNFFNKINDVSEQTKVKLAGWRSSGVRHIATYGVEYLVFDLWDCVTVKDPHGMVLWMTSTTVVSVDHVQHLSQHPSYYCYYYKVVMLYPAFLSVFLSVCLSVCPLATCTYGKKYWSKNWLNSRSLRIRIRIHGI